MDLGHPVNGRGWWPACWSHPRSQWPTSPAPLSGVKATLLSENGEIKFVDTVIGTYGPLQGNRFFGGAFKDPKSYDILRFNPVGPEHNCVVSPVKKLAVQADAWIVNGQPGGAMAGRMILD